MSDQSPISPTRVFVHGGEFWPARAHDHSNKAEDRGYWEVVHRCRCFPGGCWHCCHYSVGIIGVAIQSGTFAEYLKRYFEKNADGSFSARLIKVGENGDTQCAETFFLGEFTPR